MKEFENVDSDKPIPFKVTGEEFTAIAPNLCPAITELKYSQLVGIGQIYVAHINFFNAVLEEESAKRFMERLDSKTEPITLNTMADIMVWLMEQYSGNAMQKL